MFGAMYYDPAKEETCHLHPRPIEALASLIQQGKVRYIGLSNETPLWRA
jgi:aryl-alcohol dehydrogenase-like predicted oxidoreductase